ncbi:cell wall hydrolase [Sphingobium sp. ba1]|uniref:cell wall hydrolase n=1 Tax=Sphingobium sp. ba1 TaxID=1522072 RepID=UPI00056A11E8|nr:cell wall hydrolase [Sphingobium sp. ba1]
MAFWALMFVGLPMGVAGWDSRQSVTGNPLRFAAEAEGRAVRPPSPPPPVEPVAVYALDADRARAVNAAIPFSRLANPPARPFLFSGSETDLARAVDCLAAAELYEAGDDAVGEQAVAQVVLNRARHPAFPKTVCGVVFQGQERRTGCQFTFSCDGALTRTPSQAAWERARAIARAALAGQVFAPVGHATHYHTNWVVPYWSGSLDKIGAVGTHLFFRWRGWWGTPPAFRRGSAGGEPLIGRIAKLSLAHQGGEDVLPDGSVAPVEGIAASALAAQPKQAIGEAMLGRTIAGVRLAVLGPDGTSFLVELPRGGAPDQWPELARTFCAGRPECRIMAWRAGAAPTKIPLSDGQLETMSFAYIHNSASGLQRALWNCAQTPRSSKAECMRQRVPTAAPAPSPDAALAGVRRKERFETVKIAPVESANSIATRTN